MVKFSSLFILSFDFDPPDDMPSCFLVESRDIFLVIKLIEEKFPDILKYGKFKIISLGKNDNCLE